MKKFLIFAFSLFASLTLSAKNVSVTVSPTTAIVLQKGKVIQPVRPGVYSLSVILGNAVFVAEADGYDPEQFIINLQSPSTLQVDLKPNRKNVSISASPRSSTIYVDGKECGKGAVDFTINKNEKKIIKIEEDGYDTVVKEINFHSQKDINMSFNIEMAQNRREVNVLVDAPAAEFYANGRLVAKGKNNATFSVYKDRDVELVVRAEGFLEYSRIIKFSENVSSYNLTQDMSVDEAYAASEPGADIANKRIEFMVNKNMTREDAIKRLKFRITNIFESLEVNDNSVGWYRTIWIVKPFAGGYYVRTRLEIKEVPDNGDGQLKFNFLLQSQITCKEHARDEDYSNWNRVLKEYMKLAVDLRNSVQ